MYVDGWISLGNAHNTAERQDDAIECYGNAVRIKPNEGRAYYSRGRILLAKERFDEATADFGEAITLYNRKEWKADAYFNRAQAHEGAGRYREAIADFNQSFNMGVHAGIQRAMTLRDTHNIHD